MELKTKNSRLHWVDAMRGFSMILVVLGHVLLYMGIGGETTILSSVLMSFRMPLFFFVSGYFSYRAMSWWSGERIYDILGRKVSAQIVSTVIFLSIFQIVFDGRLDLSHGFGGYWFTIVLFQIYVLYLAVSVIDKVINVKISLIAMAVFSAIGVFLSVYPSHYTVYEFLHWNNLSHFLQFFTLGLLCSKYKGQFFELLNKDSIITTLIIGWLFLLLVGWRWSLNSSSLFLTYIVRYELVKYFSLLIVIMMFYTSSSYLSGNTAIPKFLRFIGQRTLDIYFIHFFFLPDLKEYSAYFIGGGNMFVIQLMVSVIITLLVLFMSITISSILRKSSALECFLFGVKKKQTN